MMAPWWSHCWVHEYQIRKAAIQFTQSQGLPRTVYRNEHHRMEQWVTTIPNASSPSPPSVDLTSKLNRMEQQIVTLLRQRLRTPVPGRGLRNQPKAAQEPQPASPAPQQQKKGKGKGAKGSCKKGKDNGKATPQPASGHLRSFSEIRQFGARAKAAYRANAAFQKGVGRLLKLPVTHALPSHSMPSAAHLHRLQEGQRRIRRLSPSRQRPVNDRHHWQEQHACQCCVSSCRCRHSRYCAAPLLSLPKLLRLRQEVTPCQTQLMCFLPS